MSPLATEIEIWLRARNFWVKEQDICKRFGVTDRQLRNTANRPGLLSDFAISGNDGYKHVRNATADEWDAFTYRIRNHSIAQLRRLKTLRAVRTNQFTGPRPFLTEVTSGQGVLL
jgi:hypothetical protein